MARTSPRSGDEFKLSHTEAPVSWLVPFDKGAPFGRRGLVRFLVFLDRCERLSLFVAPLRGDEASAALHEAEDADIPAVHFGHRRDADELHCLVRLHLPVKGSRLEAVKVMPVEGWHRQSSSSSPAGYSSSL